MALNVYTGVGGLVTSPASSVSSLSAKHAERPVRLGHAASSSIASTGSATPSSASSSVISTPSQSSGSSHRLEEVVASPVASTPSSSGSGARLKRALAGARRKVAKKSTVDDGMTSADEYSSSATGLSVAQRAARWGTQVRANTGPPLARLGNAVFGRAKSPAVHAPPVPPPKPERLRANAAPHPASVPPAPAPAPAAQGDSPIVASPTISAALMYMASNQHLPQQNRSSHDEEERDEITPTNAALRRTTTAASSSSSRRTSVAATIRPVSGAPSVATIRNAAHSGAEDPAASTNYNASHDSSPSTTDHHASDTDSQGHRYAPLERTIPFASPAKLPAAFSPTPSPSTKQQKRRSMSLDLSQLMAQQKSSPAWHLTTHQPSSNPPAALAAPPGTVSNASLASREDVRGIIGASSTALSTSSSSSASGHASDTGSLSFRDRLTALKLASSQPPPPPPPSHPNRRQQQQPPGAYVPPPPPRRSPAVSMQSLQQSIGPAAASAGGIAFGFGKKAYDRVEKLWGGSNSSASSAGSPAPGAKQQRYGAPLLRVQSNDPASSQSPGGEKKHGGGFRRTPNAPSGAWSVASLALGSEEDASAAAAGAHLGPCLRAAKTPHGAASLVFARPLVDCVRETRATPRLLVMSSRTEHKAGPVREIEQRLLPALIVRCVEHLMKWGVEEEGLFRISGRASHIAKLRAAFDNGADYDLKEAGPSQLDPHAVASAFKAYLRELPEPILTRSLCVKFDEVIASSPTTQTKQTQEFYGLPSGPAGQRAVPQMRKPPSLSNLGPAWNASPSILYNLSVLIARLPQENRDLVFTVIELLKVTAANVKYTKMPMANLLLLFCPSLQVSPAVLRLLCEAEGVWEGPLPEPPKAEAPSTPGRELPSPVSEEPSSFDGTVDYPQPPRRNPISGPGLGAIGGGPRQRAHGINGSSRSPVPGIVSTEMLQDMFTVTALTTPTPPAIASSTPSSSTSPYFHFSPPPGSATNSPSRKGTPPTAVGFPMDKPLPRSPRTPTSSAGRDGEGGSLKRRLSLFGIVGGGGRNSAASSSSNVDDQGAPSSPSMRDRKRVISKPSLQLMFSNRRSQADLFISPPSPTSRAGPATPPVLELPRSNSPAFSVSMESLMGDDEREDERLGPGHSTTTLNTSTGSAASAGVSATNLGVSTRSRNRSRSPSPSGRASPGLFSPAPRVAPLGVPLRPPSPGPAAAYGQLRQLSPRDRKPSVASISVTLDPADLPPRSNTPIADMFRSPSRMGLVDDRDDDDEGQIMLLPPLAFSNSPMFKMPSPATPATATILGSSQGPPSNVPRVELSSSQHRRAAAVPDDTDDWTRDVLDASRTSTDGRPPRVADTRQLYERNAGLQS